MELLVAPLSTPNTSPSKTGPSVTPAEPVMPSGQNFPDPSLTGFFFSVCASVWLTLFGSHGLPPDREWHSWRDALTECYHLPLQPLGDYIPISLRGEFPGTITGFCFTLTLDSSTCGCTRWSPGRNKILGPKSVLHKWSLNEQVKYKWLAQDYTAINGT